MWGHALHAHYSHCPHLGGRGLPASKPCVLVRAACACRWASARRKAAARARWWNSCRRCSSATATTRPPRRLMTSTSASRCGGGLWPCVHVRVSLHAQLLPQVPCPRCGRGLWRQPSSAAKHAVKQCSQVVQPSSDL